MFVSMVVGDSCDREERQRQDEEDKGLDQANKDLQPQKRNGEDQRHQRSQHQ